MAESPTHTELIVPADGAAEYRSVPGRATSPNRRRIDMSCEWPFGVHFYRLRPVSGGGVDRYDLGIYLVADGTPFMYPVPEEASMEDLLLVVTNLADSRDIRVQVMDLWRSN